MVKSHFTQKITTSIFLSFSILLFAQAQTLKTPAEESNFTRYSQNEDIARFLSAVDFLSKETIVQAIGKTKEMRGFSPKDIFLCIVNEDGASTPATLIRKKPTFLLTASQHGNEQSGKEAALGLIRDLGLGELKPLLKKMNFLIIPQSNPYGNWFDVRENEIGLDMNRDHIKLEAEGVQAIHRIFRVWMPEVTMDVHEKGDDYYRVSIGCVSNINIQPKFEEFSRNIILAQVAKNLEKKRLTFFE
jgi:murein tripeptide amidase MpaA